MTGVICAKCMNSSNDARPPKCERAGCPGNQTFAPFKSAIPIKELFAYIQPKADACEHDFKGWRDFPDGNGGEQVCTKCGIGAMAYSLRTGD